MEAVRAELRRKQEGERGPADERCHTTNSLATLTLPLNRDKVPVIRIADDKSDSVLGDRIAADAFAYGIKVVELLTVSCVTRPP